MTPDADPLARWVHGVIHDPLALLLLYAAVGLVGGSFHAPDPRAALTWGLAYIVPPLALRVLLVGPPGRGAARARSLLRLAEVAMVAAATVLVVAVLWRLYPTGGILGGNTAPLNLGAMGLDPLGLTLGADAVATLAGVAVLVSLTRSLQAPSRTASTLWALALLPSILLLAATLSPLGILPLLLALPVVHLLAPPRRSHRHVPGVLAGVLALGALALALDAAAHQGDLAVQLLTLGGRTTAWPGTLDAVAGNPLLGWGFDAPAALGLAPWTAWLVAALQAGVLGVACLAGAWLAGLGALVRLDLAHRFREQDDATRGSLALATSLLLLLLLRSLLAPTGAALVLSTLLLVAVLGWTWAEDRWTSSLLARQGSH